MLGARGVVGQTRHARMITPLEIQALQKDAFDMFQQIVLVMNKHPEGIPDNIFKYKVIPRLQELNEVAKNIERAAHNREMVK